MANEYSFGICENCKKYNVLFGGFCADCKIKKETEVPDFLKDLFKDKGESNGA